MFEVINDRIRFNRKIDEDQEALWDLMICGRAAGAKQYVAKQHVVLRYIVDLLVSIVVCLLLANAMTSHVETTTTSIVPTIIIFVFLAVLSTAGFIVVQCMGKFSPMVKFLVSLAVSAVAGILVAVISSVIIIIIF